MSSSTSNVTDELLSIADISRHFELPESTTRYYCKRFASYIPSVGEGRRRRFRPETLDIIATILDEMKKSRTASAVEVALANHYPCNAVAVSSSSLEQHQETAKMMPGLPAAAIQLMERQTAALEGIAEILRLVMDKVALVAHPQRDDSQSLRKDVDNLRILLHASEKTQQADLDQLRTWMTRVIQRQGGVSASATV